MTDKTEAWVADRDGAKFWGTIRQLTECARCGEPLRGGHHTPRHTGHAFKPTMHFICDDCYEPLPE